MIPRVICSSCGNELALQDQFCSRCGSNVEWHSPPSPAQTVRKKVVTASGTVRCKLCGHENPSDAAACESCGAELSPSAESGRRSASPAKQSPPTSHAFKPLQSWKMVVGFGVLLVVVLFVLRLSRPAEPSAGAPPPVSTPTSNNAEMMKRIETLQNAVAANPRDAASTLELANMLHDAKSLPQSITMYRRYLEMNPSNPDARVDLGISYFERSLSDSTMREELLDSAKMEMRQALTYAPKHQLAHFNLGVVCLHTGDLQQAVEWFKKCIAIDPNSETGQRAQQLINQHAFTNPSQ